MKLSKSCITNSKVHSTARIVLPVNIYGATILNDVTIGPFVEIQKNTEIGPGTKIQSHSFICEFVSIGSSCFIGHGVMFINDRFINDQPANGNKQLWSCTKIGNNVSIGSNATILPVSICDSAVIGAGAVVTKDINIPGVYAGNPAKLIRPLR